MSVTFVIYFEPPFWVGIVELREGDTLRAARHIFGTQEPTTPEVEQFMLHGYSRLARKAAQAMAIPDPQRTVGVAKNRKRIRHERVDSFRIESKEALDADYAARKLENRRQAKAQKLADREAIYMQRKAKNNRRKQGH